MGTIVVIGVSVMVFILRDLYNIIRFQNEFEDFYNGKISNFDKDKYRFFLIHPNEDEIYEQIKRRKFIKNKK